MKSITSKELKNRTGAVLRLVRAGTTVAITNRGRRVAVIEPATAAETKEQTRERGSSEAWADIETALNATPPKYSDYREAMRCTRGRP